MRVHLKIVTNTTETQYQMHLMNEKLLHLPFAWTTKKVNNFIFGFPGITFALAPSEPKWNCDEIKRNEKTN